MRHFASFFLHGRSGEANARDGGGWTALHCAANRGHAAVVAALTAAGAD